MEVCCDVRLDGGFTGSDFILPKNKDFEIHITYPLNTPYIHKFNTGDKPCGFLGVVRQIHKAYHHIYNYESKYGVWGHDLADLVLEAINIDDKKRIITLYVGS